MLVGLGSFSGLLLCFVAADRMSPLASIVLADPIGYLSNFVSIPGGIGGLDGSFVGMLVLYGVNATTAQPSPLSTTQSRSGSQRCGARSRS